MRDRSLRRLEIRFVHGGRASSSPLARAEAQAVADLDEPETRPIQRSADRLGVRGRERVIHRIASVPKGRFQNLDVIDAERCGPGERILETGRVGQRHHRGRRD